VRRGMMDGEGMGPFVGSSEWAKNQSGGDAHGFAVVKS
jgi:hypothetical protein